MEDSNNNITIKSGHYKIQYLVNSGSIQVWERFPGAATRLYEFNSLDDLVDLLKRGENNERAL